MLQLMYFSHNHVLYIYSHANTPLGQSECVYYLSYFIKLNNIFLVEHCQCITEVISSNPIQVWIFQAFILPWLLIGSAHKLWLFRKPHLVMLVTLSFFFLVSLFSYDFFMLTHSTHVLKFETVTDDNILIVPANVKQQPVKIWRKEKQGKVVA